MNAIDIILRDDSIEIDGYVNAVERLSNKIRERNGETFRERIKKGAFKRSMTNRPEVELRLNHRPDRIVGTTTDGVLELREDSIGLHAHAVVRDAEVIEKGREGRLVGWSFGFYDGDRIDRYEERGEKVRDVYDLDFFEVSLLDDTRRPAYEGTLVNVREDDEANFSDAFEFGDVQIRDERTPEPETEPEEVKPIDYSEYDNLINKMKGEN